MAAVEAKPAPEALWWNRLPECISGRVFYGWVILVACTCGKIMSSPGQSACIGPATDAIQESLGLSQTTITALYLVGTTSSSITLPYQGRLLDRIRPRKFVVLVSFCLGCSCFYLALIPAGALAPPMLLLGFYFLRFFGQGGMFMASVTPINLWWVSQRGTMMGVAGAFASLGMMGVFPPLMNHDITAHGWRHTYLVLGTMAWCFAPFGWAFYRDVPENFGLLPDGRKPSSAEDPAGDGKGTAGEPEPAPVCEENWTLQEARGTLVFWTTCLSIGQLSATGTAYVFHLRRAFRDAGLPDGDIDRIYFVIAVASVLSRLLGGRLQDKTSVRFVMTLGMAAQGVGMIMMGWLTPTTAMLCAFIQGASGGIMMNANATAFANFFGRKHIGAIQSFAQSAGVLGSALGPFPFGLLHDHTGSYFWAWLVSGVLSILNCWVSWMFMKPPVKPSAAGGADPAQEQKSLLGAVDGEDDFEPRKQVGDWAAEWSPRDDREMGDDAPAHVAP